MESIIQSVEETVLQVHISDWVDAIWEDHTSWHLSVSVGPLVLDSLHVPLIDEDEDFLVFALVDNSEDVIISSVDENTL